jgi:hypothetical protein
MRSFLGVVLTAALLLGAAGCAKDPYGPKVPAFTGRLVQDGKPVTFPDGKDISLKVFHEKGFSFGIPIHQDGSFQIGWMPIGKYTVMLIEESGQARGPRAKQYNVPGGLTIEGGKTEYTIDLGKGWKSS